MKVRRIVKEAREHAEPYRITRGDQFRLKDFEPEDTGALKSKEHAEGLQHSPDHVVEPRSHTHELGSRAKQRAGPMGVQ